MRKFSVTAVLLIVFVAAELVSCDPSPNAQRPQFLDSSPFAPPRRPPPRNRVPPKPTLFRGPPPRQQRPRPFLNGPPPPRPSEAFAPKPLPDEPEQALSIGQLPLSERPEFDNLEFSGTNEPQFPAQGEKELEGGFKPLFAVEEEQEEQPEPEQEPQPQEVQAEERSSPGPLLDPTSPPGLYHSEEFLRDSELAHVDGYPSHFEDFIESREESIPHFSEPDHHFDEDQRLQEQETQDIEFLSAPPPTHRRHNPGRTRRPAHPNQIPIYNVRDDGQYNGQEEPAENAEEEEEEEPDRLAILLLSSKFSCIDKNNGYYADEDVQCEVFHYCQDRVKHSWLCPEGASFHQVHLICMPRSEDNICERSSTFHFVNDFLYKELHGPNKTTYADRYYPEGFANGVGIAVGNQGVVVAAGDDSLETYPSDVQPDSFTVPQNTRRRFNNYQNQSPSPAPEQAFYQGQVITDQVQQSQPNFQSPEHFQGHVQQHNPSFQSPHDFSGSGHDGFQSYHTPEQVVVQRQRPRPGRRPGKFNRHPAHIG